MADTHIAITAGSGTQVDTRTEGTNGNHRQVVVLGDPATNAGVAPVDGTAGLKVDLGADNDVTVTGSVKIIPNTSGGLTTYHLVAANSTNATVVKNSAGQLYGWYIYNSNASARKLVFHNASSTPTAGASVYFSLVIPGLSGANVFSETGIAFSTGISITTVTGLADSDNTAVAANDLVINLWYS